MKRPIIRCHKLFASIRTWWERRREQRERDQHFTFEDFITQLQQLRRLGPISKIVSTIPGMFELAGSIDETEAQRQISRMHAIYNSMRLDERRNPDILNGSRRRRIADGAGVRIIEVCNFMNQFRMVREMVERVRSRR